MSRRADSSTARRSIVVVGRLSPENPAPHFAAALRERGWLVSDFDETQAFPLAESAVGRVVGRALRRRAQSELQEMLLTRACITQANAILVVKGGHITSPTLRELRRRGLFLINWFPDFDFEHAGFDETLFASYDLIVTTKMHQVDHLRARFPLQRVAFVEHGYCPNLHRPIPTHVPEFDAIYVGNASAYKRAIMAKLAARLPHRRLAVAGARWSELGPNVVLLGPQTGDFMAEALCRARCALAFHMGPSGPYGWEDRVSARSFEIPACGVPMVHIDNSEIRRWFEPTAEFLPFSDDASLATAVELVLMDSVAADGMARAAMARAVPHYGYDRRGHDLASIIEAALADTQGIPA